MQIQKNHQIIPLKKKNDNNHNYCNINSSYSCNNYIYFFKKSDNDKPNPLLSDEISDTTSKEINPKDPIITEPDSSNNIISTLPSHDSNFPTSPTIDITTTPISVSTNTDNITTVKIFDSTTSKSYSTNSDIISTTSISDSTNSPIISSFSDSNNSYNVSSTQLLDSTNLDI